MDTERLHEIARLAAPVPGWLDLHSGAMLYVLATEYAPHGVFVELGSWQGRSATWLGRAAKDRPGARLYAVDIWVRGPDHTQAPEDLHGAFMANMARADVTSVVEPWRMRTLEAAARWDGTRRIGLLYVDADHRYEAVKADFEQWERHVCPGGYIVFDDVPSWPGPTRLVSRLPEPYEWVAAPPNQWVVRKGPADPVIERIQADLKAIQALRLHHQEPTRTRKKRTREKKRRWWQHCVPRAAASR